MTPPSRDIPLICQTEAVTNHAPAPEATQLYRNSITNLAAVTKKRDITLLFNVLLLQEYPTASLTKLPTFLSFLEAMCFGIQDGRSTDMANLKGEITKLLTQHISNPTTRYFRQVMTILANILKVVHDEAVMSNFVTAASDVMHLPLLSPSIDKDNPAIVTVRVHILKFIFVLLNDCLAALIERMDRPPQEIEAMLKYRNIGLPCTYLRLADFCKLWRQVALSAVTDEYSSLEANPITTKADNHHAGK